MDGTGFLVPDELFGVEGFAFGVEYFHVALHFHFLFFGEGDAVFGGEVAFELAFGAVKIDL